VHGENIHHRSSKLGEREREIIEFSCLFFLGLFYTVNMLINKELRGDQRREEERGFPIPQIELTPTKQGRHPVGNETSTTSRGSRKHPRPTGNPL
jgi:hypothetical protein